MTFRQAIRPALLLALAAVVPLVLTGCLGKARNEALNPPKDVPFGYVEFTLGDDTRKYFNGQTIYISEEVDGAKKSYGFIGRDELWAPKGYSIARRIPLSVGTHDLVLIVANTTGAPTSMTVEVIARKILPVTVQTSWKNETNRIIRIEAAQGGLLDVP